MKTQPSGFWPFRAGGVSRISNARPVLLKYGCSLVVVIALLVSLSTRAQKPTHFNEATQLLKTDSETPSYDDTVQWIRDTLKQSGIPAGFVEASADGAYSSTYKGLDYSLEVDGCKSFAIVRSETTTAVNPPESNSGGDGTVTLRFKIPFSSVFSFWAYADEHPKGYMLNIPDEQLGHIVVIGFLVKDDGSVTMEHTMSYPGMAPFHELVPYTTKLPQAPRTASAYTIPIGSTVPVVQIWFTAPGSDEIAPHLVKAFNHLVYTCKNRPEQAPKPLF